MRRTTAILLLAAIGTLGGCAVDDGAGDDLPVPEFPAEKGPAEFPGTSYPPFGGALPEPGRAGGPVWLIGVDGATWDLIRPGIERGELPHLARLIDEGAHGTLLSEEPTISPALWATIATGVPRFEHGVVNFVVRVPGSLRTVPAGPLDRRTPAVWELVDAAGGRAAVLSWFGAFPAEEIDGVYLSKGFRPEAVDPLQVHPDTWIERLRQRGEPVVDPRWERAIGKTSFLSATLRDDERTMDALRAVAGDPGGRLDLVAVYFAGVDVVQHVCWRDFEPETRAFPDDAPPDPERAAVIPAYYRYVDERIGEIAAMAPPEATVVVLSDHGGGPLRLPEAFHLQLEVLLEQLGLLDAEGGGEAIAISEPYRHDKSIWLSLEGVEPSGTIPVAEAAERSAALARRLGALRTDHDEPVFVSIVDHLADPAWRPGDPALTVRFGAAALFARTILDEGRSVPFDPVRLRHDDVSGSHRPEGILILRGPEIRPGRLEEPAQLYNVAPTLLYLLGLPQDRRMLRWAPVGGGVLEPALRAEVLDRRPIEMVAEYPGTDRRDRVRSSTRPGDAVDPSRDEALEKLRSLGYIR